METDTGTVGYATRVSTTKYGDRMRTELLTQQQNLMNQLNKQQQFLQQQLDSLKSPELKTIDPFGDYLFYGVSLHPKDGQLHGQGTIADTPEGSGMEAWEEAMRQLDSISSASSALPTPPATASKKSWIKVLGIIRWLMTQ